MRVTHIINTIEVGGGAEHLLTLTEGLARHGYENAVIAGRDGAARVRLEAAGVPVTVIGPMGIGAPLRVAGALRTLSPSLIHLHGSRGGLAGALAARFNAARPVVYTAHAFSFKRRLPFGVRWLAAAAEAVTCRSADHVICLTRSDMESARRYRVLRHHVTVIPNGIDVARFRGRDDRRAELGIERGAPVVGMVARLVPEKNPAAFVQMAAHLAPQFRTARFLLVGDGPLGLELDDAIGRVGLESRLLRTGHRSDIPELLATMDVLVLTSRWEGMPLIILEAMASGKPVVAPRLPGLDEVVQDEKTGLLVPPGDARAITDAVARLLTDQSAREEMGARAAERARLEFTSDRMLQAVLDVYAQARGG